jgi:hypothetical protein
VLLGIVFTVWSLCLIEYKIKHSTEKKTVLLGIIFTVEKNLLLLFQGFSYFFHTTHNRLLHITSKYSPTGCILLAGYILFVNPEDGGSIFFWNVSELLQHGVTSQRIFAVTAVRNSYLITLNWWQSESCVSITQHSVSRTQHSVSTTQHSASRTQLCIQNTAVYP